MVNLETDLKKLEKVVEFLKKHLFATYTIFIVWFTLLKREPRGFERVFKLELF